MDWAYKTHPDENSCKGSKNGECSWSKGKAMGGSSSINAMLYLRGHPADYDEWSKDSPNWGYQGIVPYYEKIEKLYNVSTHNDISNPLYDLMQKSWNELGFRQSHGGTAEATIGTKISQLLVDNGRRMNTAKASLYSASQNTNLHVMKRTIVQRVIIDAETRSVRKVEIKSENGVYKHIAVRKEVILSAGSIASPQILMASGIGPFSNQDYGIENIITLPVGKNLQDHLTLPLFLQFGGKYSTELSDESRILIILEYMLAQTGKLSNIGLTDFMCFASTKNETIPDVQFHHILFTANDDVFIKAHLNGLGYQDAISDEIYRLNKVNNLLGIYPTLLHPKSTGEILLAAKDPMSNPVIKTNYLQHPQDMATVLRAVRLVQNLTKTSQFREYGITLPNFRLTDCLAHPEDSDSYWECYIKHMTATIYHPVGTAKMGLRSDKNSVVDYNLLVHGMKNLRVVDASVMPIITGANTMAPTLVIAEKAADIIKDYYKVNDEL